MAINATGPNYCRSKGEQIALNVDGAAYDETNTYSTYVRPRKRVWRRFRLRPGAAAAASAASGRPHHEGF